MAPRIFTEETLDPVDWTEARQLSHRIVDEAVGYLQTIRERPAWRAMPADVQAFFQFALPKTATPLSEIYDDVAERIMAYPMGNIHPRFWAWYMGSSNYTGALAEFLAAVQGSNLGGGHHAAALVDAQVVNWCKEIVGFPASASGTLVSGGSMANLMGLTVARNVMSGIDIREEGVAAMSKRLTFYGSDQLHSCHRKALECLGLGNRALRRIRTDADLRIETDALMSAIDQDRSAGNQPACIIATAGTVNTGAIDDLHRLSEIADREGLWLHVDGCIGALLAIAPESRALVTGIERADSIALDPHKLLHSPFEAGCILVRNAPAHRAAFAVTPEFLEKSPRGLASGEWLHEYGLQTTRGFRALKIWMSLREHGIEKFGRLIDQSLAQARYLTRLINDEPQLRLVAPTSMNIVCFRYEPREPSAVDIKSLNIEIMLQLQEQGVAVLSDTTVHGLHCLRVAISNHRTRTTDLDLLVRDLVRIGGKLELEAAAA